MNRKRALIVAAVVVIVVILFLLLRSKPQPEPQVDVATPAPADAKLAFDPAARMDIARDYDQRGKVALRNDHDVPHAVRVEADPPDDLFAGFVGRGTRDWYERTDLQIGPGETWEFPFIVHANAARDSEYTIPIRAMVQANGQWVPAAAGEVHVAVAPAELKIETRWIEPDNAVDKARLVRILEIHNTGANVPDLEVAVAPGDVGRVRMHPEIGKYQLDSRQVISLRVWPRLHPNFQNIDTTLTITGHNQSVDLPFTAAVPEGSQLYVVTARSTGMSGRNGSVCTNQGSASYSTGASTGTPSSAPSGWGGASGGTSGGGGGIGGGGGMSGGGGLNTSSPTDGEEDEADEEEDEEDLVWSDNPFSEEGEEKAAAEDKGTVDTVEEIMDDVEEGTLPASATGSDPVDPEELLESLKDKDGKLPPGEILNQHMGDVLGRSILSEDDPRHPDYFKKWAEAYTRFPVPLLRDPVAATKETTAHVTKDGKRGALITRHRNQNGERKSGLVFENFGFGIQGRGRTIKGWRIPIVSGQHAVKGATLGSGPNKEMVAVFGKPVDEGGEVIEVRDVESDKKVTLGDPEKISKSPKMVDGDVVFVEDGKVKTTAINDDFTAGESQVLLEQPVDDLVAARKDGNGKLAVLAQADKGKMILAAGEARKTIEGRGGDFLIDDAGKRTIVVRRNDGAIEQVDDDGNTVARLAQPSAANGPPALVKTKAGNLRAIFHQGFGLSPQLLAKSQLPMDDQPGTLGGGGTFQFDLVDGEWTGSTTLPQPEQPITDAAVVFNASIPYGRAHYRTQDVKINLNGYRIGELANRVPNGRYVFPVPPGMLNTRAAWDTDAGENVVAMKIRGIGKGNFAKTEGVEIYTRHALVQEYLVAPSREDAAALSDVTTPDMRHACPDLMLASNDWELPRGVQRGQTVAAAVNLFNAGDAEVPAGEITATGGGETLGRAAYDALAPFAHSAVSLDIAMPSAWQPGTPLQIVLATDVPGDPNPDNHRLTFVALRDYVPDIAGPRRPARVRMTDVTGVETIDFADGAYVKPLNEASTWYRFKAPPKGQLQVDLIDAPGDVVLSMDLFSDAGELLEKQDDVYALPGEWIYLRVGLRPRETIPPAAQIKIGWQTP